MNTLFAQIPLGNGRFTEIDAEDYNDLSQFNWFLSSQGYAVRNVSRGKAELMHRRIMQATPGTIVDHKDINRLNNRKANLRMCTASQNGSNTGIPRNNTSGFKGVSTAKRGRFRAQIKIDRRYIHLGTFDTPNEASEAYKAKAEEHFGAFARMNA